MRRLIGPVTEIVDVVTAGDLGNCDENFPV